MTSPLGTKEKEAPRAKSVMAAEGEGEKSTVTMAIALGKESKSKQSVQSVQSALVALTQSRPRGQFHPLRKSVQV